ncbi:TauD/TfdA family dioxygenase [Pantoea ananatis]|uniref:TauD/TfdA family dioxygenase n=1 Tax=Pantoea ananas TaxID=553 RepID=UPI001B317087|nr:TauD/TfdA family dioxygenase [Pantoea ananatis]
MNHFYEVKNCSSVEQLLSLARNLGEITHHPNGELYDIICANDGSNARTGSFSHNFGFQSFPLHTDTAFWDIPARFLLMWSPKASAVPTTFIPWTRLLDFIPESKIRVINDAIFTVHTYESVKYCSLKFKFDGRQGFRFDPNIMKPANKHAIEFCKIYNDFFQSEDLNEFSWLGCSALILDNWHVLHGRGHVATPNENRKIFRVYVR